MTTAAGEIDHRRIPLSQAHEHVCILLLDAAAKKYAWKAAFIAVFSNAGVVVTIPFIAETVTTVMPQAKSRPDLESRSDLASFSN